MSRFLCISTIDIMEHEDRDQRQNAKIALDALIGSLELSGVTVDDAGFDDANLYCCDAIDTDGSEGLCWFFPIFVHLTAQQTRENILERVLSHPATTGAPHITQVIEMH